MTNFNQSRTKMFRRCQRQYSFRYDYARFYPQLAGSGKKLEMIPKQLKLPLYRGTWMHALQETLHHQWAGIVPFEITVGEGKNRVHGEVEKWQDTHELMSQAFGRLFDEEKEDLGDPDEDCERLFKSYLKFYKADQDTYEVAIIDGKPAIELIVEVSLEKFGLKGNFKGKIDLIVADNEYDDLWMWDAKWVKNIPTPDEGMMSPQALLYVWAVRECYDIDLRGFVFNRARTKPPTVPHVLKNGTLSLAQKIDTDYYTYLQAIKEVHGKRWKQYIPYYIEKLKALQGREALWFDRERVPVEDDRILRGVREYCATVRDIQRREKRREYIPRTYNFTCKFPNAGCDYHDLCVAEFTGLEIEPLIKSKFQFVGERYVESEDLLSG